MGRIGLPIILVNATGTQGFRRMSQLRPASQRQTLATDYYCDIAQYRKISSSRTKRSLNPGGCIGCSACCACSHSMARQAHRTCHHHGRTELTGCAHQKHFCADALTSRARRMPPYHPQLVLLRACCKQACRSSLDQRAAHDHVHAARPMHDRFDL
jgi:hypothetical protein